MAKQTTTKQTTPSPRTLRFREYVRSFYGPGGVYDMGATDAQIADAVNTTIEDRGDTFEGDSIDREHCRDVLIERFGLEMPPAPLSLEINPPCDLEAAKAHAAKAKAVMESWGF